MYITATVKLASRDWIQFDASDPIYKKNDNIQF